MSQPRFKFVGKPKLPSNDSKKPFVKIFEKDKKQMASLNFGIQEGKNSIVFVECFDSVRDKIKTKDTDGNDIEIKWEDRFNEDVVKSVVGYRKYVCDLGEDFGGRKEFITGWDFIAFLKENLPEYKGKVCVNGQWNKQWYKDKYYDKFPIVSVYAVDDEEASKFYITADIYYRKDCVDVSDWKENKKIYVDGYIQQYINKDEGTKFIPQRFVFSGAKYKPDNEKHQKLLAYRRKYIESKSKKWTHLLWECVMLNGTELIEFDESQLTAAQKEQIELGIKTIDDFKPKGSIFGDIVYEYRFCNPSLIKASETDDFSNGAIELDYTDDEFDELVYEPAQDEKMSDVMNNSKKSSNKKDEEDDEYVEGSTDKELDEIFDGINKPEDDSDNDDETTNKEDDSDDDFDDDLFS